MVPGNQPVEDVPSSHARPGRQCPRVCCRGTRWRSGAIDGVLCSQVLFRRQNIEERVAYLPAASLRPVNRVVTPRSWPAFCASISFPLYTAPKESRSVRAEVFASRLLRRHVRHHTQRHAGAGYVLLGDCGRLRLTPATSITCSLASPSLARNRESWRGHAPLQKCLRALMSRWNASRMGGVERIDLRATTKFKSEFANTRFSYTLALRVSSSSFLRPSGPVMTRSRVIPVAWPSMAY